MWPPVRASKPVVLPERARPTIASCIALLRVHSSTSGEGIVLRQVAVGRRARLRPNAPTTPTRRSLAAKPGPSDRRGRGGSRGRGAACGRPPWRGGGGGGGARLGGGGGGGG